MTLPQKQFPNGDVVVHGDTGLVYRTTEAAYTVELDPPGHPLSDEPFGVDLIRTTPTEHGLNREQRLTLAEYHSYMAAEEHVREVEKTLLEQGREGLSTEMALVEAMPFEPDTALYLVGRYPPDPDANIGTLNLLRLDGERLNITPVAHGSTVKLVEIEQRLFEVHSDGDPNKLLQAATLEAQRAEELAPGTPLFALEGDERHLTASVELPVTFDEKLTPFNAQGHYVPHYQDEANRVHFFSIVDNPTDDPVRERTASELRYFRAQQDPQGSIRHDSFPVMTVADPATSPWLMPALGMYLEEGDLDAAQKLARDTAHDNGLSFPDKLPELGREPSPEKPETGWYHFDAVLLATEPQGIDDGYGVGVVDVYTHRETGDFAARYLPMGEYATFDAALERQHTLLHHRLVEGRDSALETSGFNHSPALYKRFAQQEADNALTDLLEKYDGHYPPDYDGDYEPEWEPLASKEWEAYRDHVQVISEIVPGTDSILKSLPSATPGFASNTLAAASDQPEAPYHLPEELQPQAFSPFWHLDIVPAHDTEGQSLGYSAVCVVDYGDLAEVVAPDSTECAMWLEVAQFQTEDRANQFKDDFMSLVKSDELDHITGPALAGFIADDLGTESQWQTMNQATLDKLNAGKWTISHAEDAWQPRLNGDLPNHTIEVASIDIAL